MKVLIITYYWIPSGGSGVQRWLFFTKYLREFGIEPIIFTIANPNYALEDQDLEKHIPSDIEVVREPIFEPVHFLNKKNKKKGAGFLNKNPNLLQKILLYIRANYFIPDARKFWIKPASKRIIQYLTKHPVDWIISTGPPHSTHLIAKAVKEKTDIKWLADFRDPWTNIDYFHHLPLTQNSLQKHRALEKSVLSLADVITVVSNSMKKEYDTFNSNCHVITNGYDAIAQTEELDKKFTLTHIGLLNADRNSPIFWQVIREIIDENPEFSKHVQIQLIGKIADEVQDSMAQYKLDKYVKFLGYLTHEKAQSFQQKSQVLLLFVNRVPSAKGIVTGKVFEYLASKRPILAIGPKKGDLATIIKETNTGKVIDFDDIKALKQEILRLFTHYQNGVLQLQQADISKYQRKNLSGQLAQLLKNN